MSDCELGPHDHLACLPPTKKEQRSMRLLQRLRPDTDDREALSFVRVFAWHISRAPGGVEGLLRGWR